MLVHHFSPPLQGADPEHPVVFVVVVVVVNAVRDPTTAPGIVAEVGRHHRTDEPVRCHRNHQSCKDRIDDIEAWSTHQRQQRRRVVDVVVVVVIVVDAPDQRVRWRNGGGANGSSLSGWDGSSPIEQRCCRPFGRREIRAEERDLSRGSQDSVSQGKHGGGGGGGGCCCCCCCRLVSVSVVVDNRVVDYSIGKRGGDD